MSGGSLVEVTAQNVHDYVRRYADYRMFKVAQKALKVGSSHLVQVLVCESFVKALDPCSILTKSWLEILCEASTFVTNL